ncbi:MAG: hypothetical protein ABL962_12825 [Fimbriimonadaceae bacterium]
MLNFNKLKNRRSTSTARTAAHVVAAIGAALALSIGASAADRSFDYRMLATSKTSTMEKELNEGAAAGYRFSKVMGGKATNGGQVIIAMVKEPGQEVRKYRLLATTRTSTMQTEMQQLADRGYSYLDHTVFESATGGKEVVVIMELDSSKSEMPRCSYRLLATTRTSTMQKELEEAGAQGYALLGFTAGKTAGGSEVIAILRKDK